MADARVAAVNGVPQRLNVTVLLSPFVVRVSLTGSTRDAADAVTAAAVTAPLPFTPADVKTNQ